MASPDAIPLLLRIAESLERIENLILTRSVVTPKKKDGRRVRLGRLAAEAKEALEDQEVPRRVLALWAELMPDHPQPIAGLDVERRTRCRDFWKRWGGEEGVRSVFLTISGDDWWCGRDRRNHRKPCGLWEAIAHAADIVEKNQ